MSTFKRYFPREALPALPTRFLPGVAFKVMAAAVLLAGAAGVATHAHADNLYWSVGVGSPGVSVGITNGWPGPVSVQPAPVYVQPAPVYLRPSPVLCSPLPWPPSITRQCRCTNRVGSRPVMRMAGTKTEATVTMGTEMASAAMTTNAKATATDRGASCQGLGGSGGRA